MQSDHLAENGINNFQQQLEGWTVTESPYPHQATIHQLFEGYAAQTPQATALLFGEETITYNQLNQQANQLAHYLQQQGVGPEVLVGVFLERSPEYLVSLLAILKAGGAYLPLDVNYPSERLAFMLADTQAPLVLTHHPLLSNLPPAETQVICLDTTAVEIARESVSNLGETAVSANLAYVMYTSGSTGQPKGIGISHQNVVRLVKETNYAHLSSTETFLHVAPASFDAATFEIWGSLLNGAKLVIYPPTPLTLSELAQVLRERDITTLWLTAGLFHLMVDEQLDSFKGVTQLMAGGDILSPSHVHKVVEAHPNCHLINGYGPTENTTFTTCHSITHTDSRQTSIPIGKPVANTQVYILDETMQPVPVGVVGELYAGGDGLARGYLNRAGLTAERFVPNPFSEQPGARLYRTGDLVRYRADGNIEFVGRQDQQVKIRGFRIELGEIEAVLSQHSTVQQAMVTAREDAAQGKQLVAYVVGPTAEHTEVELRAYLQKQLPDYMIPAHFVLLEYLPLSPNGKIDRHALPAPDKQRRTFSSSFVAPQTASEEKVCEIWCEILGLSEIGIHDNFFEIGGHSLALTQIAARLCNVFKVDIPLITLFDRPTIGEIAAYLDQITQQTVLFEIPEMKVCRDAEQTIFPLSFSQERVWFMRELLPDNRAYNAQFTVRFRGRIDISILEKALSMLVDRHEIWRTTFSEVNNWPMQHIHPAWQVQIPITDFSHLPEKEREIEAEKHIKEAFNYVFDTSQLPLLHFQLIKLADDDHILIQVEHHFIHDGWSFSVQQKEFKAIYTALCQNEPILLPEAVQFADFVVWQREWFQGKVLETQLAYWQKQLANLPPMTEILTDYPRPLVQTLNGEAIRTTISADLASRLRAFSHQENATLFITMLAALKLLFVHYTGQEDIVVGSSVANRRLAEFERVIGMIVNNLVMRTDLSGDPTFREIIQLVRQTALEAYDYQDIPFERIVEAIQPARDLGRNPFFQVVFNFHDAPVPALNLPGVHGEIGYCQNGSAKFDLNILIATEPGRREDGPLLLVWEYNSDLFAHTTMQRMLTHYFTLMESLLADPDQRISQVSSLSESERQQILEEWNATQSSYPHQGTIHQLFEEYAAQTPQATALLFGEETLTYAQLNHQANQLAHSLQKRGVGPEVLVGLFLERSPAYIISLLAILKAGGAYLPLDVNYPPERLAFMLADTQAPLVLTQQPLLPNLPASEAQVICLDTTAAEIRAESVSNLGETAVSSNLSHVMYTSGSTGQPKGIGISHQNVIRLVKGTNYATLSSDETFLHVASASFDAATFEIWGSLLNGARLVIYPPTLPTLTELSRILHESNVTTILLTAGLFHLMVDEQLDSFKGVKQLLSGGDVLSPSHIKKVVETYPHCQMINAYGPTENTTVTTCHTVTQVDNQQTSIPIGKPIANTQVYILDTHMQPVPVGVVGELYTGGDGLARGYLNRAGLTAERFVPNPFAKQPGTRLYRTGDLVRYRQDGSIEFVGRQDEQVKIRGFRIEPGEIEAVLSQHPTVQQVVVTAREDAAQGKQLVAYVVGSTAEHTEVELRTYLQKQLPDYMIPAHFVLLEYLPLSPNGKIDRHALPVPTIVSKTAVFTPPETLVEEILAEIWGDVLGLEQVSIHDNFFQLGGHSLLVTQILSRIHAMLDVTVSLLDFFEAPTIAQLAETVEGLLADLLETEETML